jgi:hypothetical protein
MSAANPSVSRPESADLPGGALRTLADELEPRIWPHRLPAGWRWVTELDGPALRDAEPRAGRPRRRRLHDIVAGIWHVKRVVPVRDHLTYPQAERKAHSPGPLSHAPRAAQPLPAEGMTSHVLPELGIARMAAGHHRRGRSRMPVGMAHRHLPGRPGAPPRPRGGRITRRGGRHHRRRRRPAGGRRPRAGAGDRKPQGGIASIEPEIGQPDPPNRTRNCASPTPSSQIGRSARAIPSPVSRSPFSQSCPRRNRTARSVRVWQISHQGIRGDDRAGGDRWLHPGADGCRSGHSR